jgi:uncharacterized protein YggE
MPVRRSITFYALLAGAALAVAGCAGSAQPGDVRNLSVTGTGSAFLTPDVVIVTLGVQTQGTSIGDTVAANNQTAAQVIQAVTAMGVIPEDVQTTYFSVSTQPKYDEFGNPTSDVTYWVDNTVTVTLRDTAQLGTLLQNALASGANSVQGVTYTVDDPDAALSGARADAMADARRQAEQLAGDAGVALGDILSVSESTSNGPQFSGAGGGKGAEAASQVPTAPGTLEYQVTLSVTFGLR